MDENKQKTIGKNELVAGFAKEYEISLTTAKNLFDSMMNYIAKQIVENDTVIVSPLGTFKHVNIEGKPFSMFGHMGISPDRVRVNWKPSSTLNIIKEIPFDLLDPEEKKRRAANWGRRHPVVAKMVTEALEPDLVPNLKEKFNGQ